MKKLWSFDEKVLWTKIEVIIMKDFLNAILMESKCKALH